MFGVGWVVRRVRPHSSGLGGKLTVPRGQMEKGTWTTPSFVPGDGQQGDPALLLSLPPCPRPLDLLTLTSRGSRVNTVLSEGGWGTCESLPCCCAGNQTWASWKCTLREDTPWSPSTGHLPRAGPGESGGHTSWERVTRAGGRREQ